MFALVRPLHSAVRLGGQGRFIAALLGAISFAGADAAIAQSNGEVQRVASSMSTGAPGWQQGLRNYLDQAGGDSGAVVDRARDIFKAYNQYCMGGGAGCTGAGAREAAQVAASSACAAQVLPVAVSDTFVPRRGAVGYDFQPVGATPIPGFRPIVPGDARMQGGSTGVSSPDKGNLADDSLNGVKYISVEAPGNGDYRLILIGAKGTNANPFGSQVVVNGRVIDVTQGVAGATGTIGHGNSVVAPMVVVDTPVTSKTLDVQFMNGADVSGLILEPQSGVSALGLNLVALNNTSAEQCTAAESAIQQVARQFIPFSGGWPRLDPLNNVSISPN